jgi:hypothetical protein
MAASDSPFGGARFIKAQTELIKVQKELTEIIEDEAKVRAILTLEQKAAAVAAEKQAVIAKLSAKETSVFEKAMGKVNTKLEASAKSMGTLNSSLDIFGDKLGAETTKKIALFAGSLGLAAASAKKWTDATQAAILAVPQLQAGQTTFLDAMLSTADAVLTSGLSIQELTQAMRQNRVAFKNNGKDIVSAIGQNRAFAQAMGINNEQLANMTARTSNFAKTQDNLSGQTRDYIFNLEEVALQTGRQASEIERDRADARKGTLNLLLFQDKAGAALLQQTITQIQDKFGPAISQGVNSVFAQGSNVHEAGTNAGKALRDLARATTDNTLRNKVLALAGDAERAARTSSAKTLAQAQKDFVALSLEISKNPLSKLTRDTDAAGLSVVKAFKAQEFLVKDTGLTEKETRTALIAAQREQAKVIRAFVEGPMGEAANAFILASSAIANFGSELSALTGLLVGLKDAFTGIMGIVGVAGAVGAATLIGALTLLAGAALLVFNNFEEIVNAGKNAPFLAKQIPGDLAALTPGGFAIKLLRLDEAGIKARIAESQSRDLIVASLKKRGIAVTEENIQKQFAAGGEGQTKEGFLDNTFFGNAADSLIRGLGLEGVLGQPGTSFGGAGGGPVPPSAGAKAVTEPGQNKNKDKGAPSPVAPSSTLTPATTKIDAPTPVLAELGEQVKKAKSMEDLLRLLNENAIVQTALLDTIARAAGGSTDIRSTLRRSGVSLASLQGTR